MIDKDSLPLDKPRRTPDHPTKSHVVKTRVDGKERIIRFGEQGASTAGKPKAGESERMKAKRASFKARHAKNIAKGKSSPAYWADKVKWAEGGPVELQEMAAKYEAGGAVRDAEADELQGLAALLARPVMSAPAAAAPGYAEGGAVEVTQYDPARVDDIVNQIREGIYG